MSEPNRSNEKDTEKSDKFWIGFDLGGTKMLAIAYDQKWKELGRRRRKTRGRDSSDSGLDRICSTIERLLNENDLSADQIAGIGIGCPGPIDVDKGRILVTPNLGWNNLDVRDKLTKRFDCPVAVVNDVDAGVYGEYRFGAAKKARCVVGIFPGTGIGGGCVYQGQILQGAGISCMEIGHTRISSSDRASGYDLPGTLEAEASRLTIAAEAAKAAHRGDAPALKEIAGTDLAEIRSGALAESIQKGDTTIHHLVETAAETVGIAVVNIVHLLAPDKIVLGGGLVEAMEDLIVGTVKRTARKRVMSVYRDRFDVVPAKLGDDAGALGAAAWAASSFGDESDEV
ncbi:ROK family protein [Crateriforma conspicua]|uniref:Glucokinase n=1 Tax=Crateriforma conspicua TaxID=2527996 RepID=A0A5C5Y7M4_9PLAN|nr:ROK family protein [Crateriforma conspicua]QDV65547.1 Glucokinase [Crateriforma conspicua]TWT70938.1 Glucokinase [Crateriforma conspicua]